MFLDIVWQYAVCEVGIVQTSRVVCGVSSLYSL
jgi:hypothetical protein